LEKGLREKLEARNFQASNQKQGLIFCPGGEVFELKKEQKEDEKE
jgi:hypothetical protein